jgi:hypothetical protein
MTTNKHTRSRPSPSTPRRTADAQRQLTRRPTSVLAHSHSGHLRPRAESNPASGRHRCGEGDKDERNPHRDSSLHRRVSEQIVTRCSQRLPYPDLIGLATRMRRLIVASLLAEEKPSCRTRGSRPRARGGSQIRPGHGRGGSVMPDWRLGKPAFDRRARAGWDPRRKGSRLWGAAGAARRCSQPSRYRRSGDDGVTDRWELLRELLKSRPLISTCLEASS